MAEAQLKHLEQIQAYLRDPTSTRLPDDARNEVLALALYGQSKQDDPPFDYAHFYAIVVEGGYREFEYLPADVQRGLQRLGIEPNEKGGER